VILFLQVTKCGVVEAVLSWARFKAAKDLQKQCSGKKQNKLKGCVLKLLLL
jgi:DNA topoisomerase-2